MFTLNDVYSEETQSALPIRGIMTLRVRTSVVSELIKSATSATITRILSL